MKKLLIAGAACLAMATGAQAADLAAPRMPIAAAVVASPFNWTGFYVGADLGYWTSSTTVVLPALPLSNSAPNPHGIKLGGHVGYRHQFANNVVLGIEGDLSWLGGSSRDAALVGFPLSSWRMRANWDGSVRATAGFAVDRALIYATGGVSFIDSNGCGANGAGTLCIDGTQWSGTRVGWTVGAGLAYAVTPNVSLRGEYLYANYGTRSYTTPNAFGGITNVRMDTHTFRLGVSYLFTTGGGSVVARY